MIKIQPHQDFSEGGTEGTREKRYEMVISKYSLQGEGIYIYMHIDKSK